ncbi:cell division protein FtsQ/DivIB [Alteromonas oceanisediminis]|uniref:cell division protein FtsQ/DivIB n=1 Tax=Alteromonas oceanisediminis TaxID=2836180 RepID=UPI001BDB035B|nr:cell division protein FtsQ/DivIB [Alteromonas oceanisediminis]MBT0585528.1 cell division protein FtsQ/DivIB [Alteromonas oceanisediminis]
MTTGSRVPPSTHTIAGMAFLLVVIAGLVASGFSVYRWLHDAQQLPVQQIAFLGEQQHIDTARLEALVRQSQQGSFFALDVNEVYRLLEAQPWVYRASVRKQWPNKLTVFIVEQQAVAQWNDDLLLNPYGETFSGGHVERLPRLYGPSGSEKTALQGYNAMQTILTGAALPIHELFLSERFAWQITLQNQVRLNLGRQEFIDRLQRFVDVYPLLKQDERAVDYVDLRYDTGLAVGWSGNEKRSENV